MVSETAAAGHTPFGRLLVKSLRHLVVLGLALLGLPARAGAPLFVVAELPTAGWPYSIEARRLGRDAALSLVSVSPASVQTWRVGTISEPTVSPGGGRYPAFADFDGDGLLDLALIRDGFVDPPARIVILRGDGAGHFAEQLTITLEGQGIALEAADVDGDGRADLVLATSSLLGGESPTLLAYVSVGPFRFGEPRATPLDSVINIGSTVAGDLDGDGRADVVVAEYIGSVSVWRNRGDGTFAATTQGLPGYYPGRPILADFDGDGRPDLAYVDVFRYPPFSIEICRNDGAGVFTWSGRISIYSGQLAVADENGDGNLDLLVRQADDPAGSRISVFHGDGRGAFGAEARRPLPPYARIANASEPVPVDWGSDGRLDFVLGTQRGLVVVGPVAPRVDVTAVPVLLSTTGYYGSRFDSDLLLTNTGPATVRVDLRYVATIGGGSGVVTREIGAGQQLFAPSALDFLRVAGLPTAREGPLVGTLRVETSGAALPTALRATVRTTSPGGAGVSWAGVPSLDALRGDSFIPWLVESDRDRTNVGLANVGGEGDGPITLRVTLQSGDPATPAFITLADVVLPPGGFYQFGRVLASVGRFSRLGWARISRVAGNAPYLAWGAINDAGSGDGSFVPAVPATGSDTSFRVVPSVIQSARYATEVVVTNPGEEAVPIRITLVATGTILEETLAPHQVFHLPDLFAELRRRGLAGAPGPDVAIASPLYVTSPYLRKVLVGARVSTAASGGRHYGLFEPAVDGYGPGSGAATVPDLRQDERLRTNLGIVNLGGAIPFRVEIHDGESGNLVATRDVGSLASGELIQLNAVLRDLAPSTRRAWARIVPSVPTRFVAYGVVMDGPEPGLGTDDGSFVCGLPE